MSPVRNIERRKRAKTPLQSVTISVTLAFSPRECRALLDLGVIAKAEPRLLAAWAKGAVKQELDAVVSDAEKADEAGEGFR